MTHDEAMSQIGAALSHLDPRVADDQGVVYVRAMIQFVRDADGNLTRQWRYQQVDIGQDEWNPPNKPKPTPKPEFKWSDWEGCSTRTANAIAKFRPASYEEMSKYTANDLMKVRGIGINTVCAIDEFLMTKGYSLRK